MARTTGSAPPRRIIPKAWRTVVVCSSSPTPVSRSYPLLYTRTWAMVTASFAPSLDALRAGINRFVHCDADLLLDAHLPDTSPLLWTGGREAARRSEERRVGKERRVRGAEG